MVSAQTRVSVEKPSTTDQTRQYGGDHLVSCDGDGQDCNDVGLEENREGRETEAHVCQVSQERRNIKKNATIDV
jgi:hypothetical protein